MRLPPEARESLIRLAEEKGIHLEGNVLKVLDPGGDEEFLRYLDEAVRRDREARRKRLDVTKQVQSQNRELQETQARLRDALQLAEGAKAAAEDDLMTLHKKTQFQLMSRIVTVALILIVGVGASTTALYVFSLLTDRDTQLLGNAWSSMFGILLTNSFSIIGTIMGVKYATEGSKS